MLLLSFCLLIILIHFLIFVFYSYQVFHMESLLFYLILLEYNWFWFCTGDDFRHIFEQFIYFVSIFLSIISNESSGFSLLNIRSFFFRNVLISLVKVSFLIKDVLNFKYAGPLRLWFTNQREKQTLMIQHSCTVSVWSRDVLKSYIFTLLTKGIW